MTFRFISIFMTFGAMLVLTACSGAEQKPVRKWDVKVKTQGEPKVWVWKYDGSKQCEGPSKLSPDVAASSLKDGGVVVYQSRGGTDGRMYPMVCGGNTGRTVDVEIARADLQKAQGLGFRVKN